MADLKKRYFQKLTLFESFFDCVFQKLTLFESF